jgi:hypothetical protein
MQMVKKSLLIILTGLIAILIFAPKKSLYFLAEKELQKNGIVLSDETIKSNPVGLTISNAKVYVENTYVGDIKEVSILTLFIYSNIDILDFKPVKAIEKMFPLSIQKANINYAIWNPLEVKITVNSSMGEIKGKIDLSKRRLILRFLDRSKIRPIRSYLRRDKSGWYYEQSF